MKTSKNRGTYYSPFTAGTVPFTVISLKFQEQLPHFIIHIPTL